MEASVQQRPPVWAVCLVAVAGCVKPALDYREPFTVADIQAARGFDWVVDTAGPFRLYAEAGRGPAARLDEVAEELTGEVLPRIREVISLGVGDAPVYVFLLEDSGAMKRLLGWAGTGIATDSFVLHQLPADRTRLGAHEFMHVATARQFGELDGWGAWILNEGVAVYASGSWQGHDLHALTKHLRRTDRGLSLRTLLEEGRRHPERVTYPQAGSFVAYLHDRFGADALATLLARQYSSEEPVFREVLGVGLEELGTGWNAVVERADAEGIEY